MRFDPPLALATFHRRYKRFLVDLTLEAEGTPIVAHSTNTGSLRGCLVEGARAAVQPADNPNRKLRWTWSMIEVGGTWVGVDTSRAVPLVEEALDAGLIPELAGYERRVREVPYGSEGRSRIDLLLSRGGVRPEGAPRRARAPWTGDARVYVEVKSTTLVEDMAGKGAGSGRRAMFPDAVTARGLKHLHELIEVVGAGQRAAMVYVVQREDCDHFAPAAHIDPAYAEALGVAVAAGVEAYALGCRAEPAQMTPLRRLDLAL